MQRGNSKSSYQLARPDTFSSFLNSEGDEMWEILFLTEKFSHNKMILILEYVINVSHEGLAWNHES